MNKRNLKLIETPKVLGLLAFRHDGQCILSMQDDGVAHLWNWESGLHLHTFSCSSSPVLDVQWWGRDAIITSAKDGAVSTKVLTRIIFLLFLFRRNIFILVLSAC